MLVGPRPKTIRQPTVLGFTEGGVAYCWRPDSRHKTVQYQVRISALSRVQAAVKPVLFRHLRSENGITRNEWGPWTPVTDKKLNRPFVSSIRDLVHTVEELT